ncbi:UNVERIFIED_CONTAM: DHA3 family macrolide efflux protein-like MFS transporter [Brevibacillus sp. OAP136]
MSKPFIRNHPNNMPTGKPPGIVRNRFVQLIVASTIFLQTGIWVRNFSILLYVMDKTGQNPQAVSWISVAEYAPIFLFSIIGGTFADRWRPKRTMIWCDVLSAISVFAVLLAFLFASWKAIFFATLTSAVLSQFSQPSGLKLFKQHVPSDQVQAGTAMLQTITAVFMIIGPMLGAFVYQKFGITTSICVMAVAFLLSAGVLFFLPEHDQAAPNRSGLTVWQELRAGLRYVWASPLLRTLCGVYGAAGLGVGACQPLGVFIVVERLGLTKDSLQWLLATNGFAMLVGGAVIIGMAKKISPQKLVALGLFASGISSIGIGFSTNLVLTLVMQFINGFFFPCIPIGLNTIMLKKVKESYIGRVNGILFPIFTGLMVIMMSLAGWLKTVVGLVTMYELAGLLFLISVMLLVPLFKEREEAHKPETES